MASNLAGAAKKPAKYTKYGGLTTRQTRHYQKQVAQLYGRGVGCHRIALTYYDKLCPHTRGKTHGDRVAAAKRLLREWERDQAFRDMVYEEAVAKMDVDTPLVLEGVTKKAKKGRVDAAKLHLAVTGRHNPVEQQGGTANVQIVFAQNVPRPNVTGPGPIALSREVAAIRKQVKAIEAGPD